MKTAATGLRRRLGLLLSVAVAAVAVTACGDGASGLRRGASAAEVGDVNVSTDDVVAGVDRALAAGSENRDRGSLSRQYLTLQVKLALYAERTKALGIALTDADRSETRAELERQTASQGGLVNAAGRVGIGADDIGDLVELVSYERVIGKKLGERGVATEAEKAQIQAQQQQPFSDTARSAHILVEDEALAKKLIADIKAGADFGQLAAKHSIDPGSKANGGDLGSGPFGRFVPEFDQALFGADEGEVVGPIKTQFGYHIIKLIEMQTLDEFLAEQVGPLRLAAEVAKGAKVSVNPRFGFWDADRQIVAPAKDDPEAPSSPSGAPAQPLVPPAETTPAQ